MKSFRVRVAIFGSLLLGTLGFFNNCQYNNARYTYQTRNGTSVGNPMVAKTVLSAVCSVINRCHSQVNLSQCEQGILATSGFELPLGLAGSYSTYSDIMSAEDSGALSGNQSASMTCYSAINTLACTDPSVQSAYDASQSNPFASSPQLVPISLCNQVFSTGMNLEVPVDMVDNGVESNTSARTFARTRTSLDTSFYDGTVTYAFEIGVSNGDSVSRIVELVNASDLAVAQISVPVSTTSITRLRVSFTPSPGSNNYRIRLPSTSAAGDLTVYSGRMLVRQTGATKTRIFIPMTGHIVPNTSQDDDETAAIDRAGCCADYVPNALWYRTLWQKNESAFATIAPGNAFTFEAVVSASTSTAYAALINVGTGLPVVGSEASTNSTSPALLTASFGNSAAQFTNLSTFEAHVKNSGVGSEAYIYRSGIWIALVNLTHAEVYYRNGLTRWAQSPGGNVDDSSAVLLDYTAFSLPVTTHHEVAAFITQAGTSCALELYDGGLADASGSYSSMPVTNSLLQTTSTTKSLLRSGPLAIPSGHRLISHAPGNTGPGSCILLQPRVVVKF